MRPGWSNETFGEYLCGNMSSYGSSLAIVTISGTTNAFPYLLPDCFYDGLSTVSGIRTYFVAVQGNSTYPDPLVRTMRAMRAAPQFLVFMIETSFLLDDLGHRYSVDWDAIMERMSYISIFSLSGTYIGRTTLPSIPSIMQDFDLSQCGIIATLPDRLLNQTDLRASNQIVLNVILKKNQIYGTIPSGFLSAAGSTTGISFDFSYNNLTGDVPAGLFGISPWSEVKTLYLSFSYNSLNGTLPEHLFPANSFPLTQTVTVSFDNNLLTGNIPGTLLQDAFSVVYTLELDLQVNRLTGSISSGLLLLNSSSVASQYPMQYYYIQLDENELDGKIDSDLFAAFNWSQIRSFRFQASENQLTGDLPSSIFNGQSAPFMTTLNFFIGDNPKLAGTIPPTMLPSLEGDASVTSAQILNFYLDISNTNMTGTITIPGFPSRPAALRLQISAYNSNITYLDFDDTAYASAFTMEFEGCPFLTGSLPDSIFNASSILGYLGISSPLFSGRLPDLGSLTAPWLLGLRLDGSAIDVCSAPRTRWSTANFINPCTFSPSFANTSGCADLYPVMCKSIQPPSPPPPTSSPPSSQVTCVQSSSPGPSFTCIDGHWTYVGTFTSPTITIPSGGGSSVVISGEVTSTTIIFQGTGTSLDVDGCVANLSSVVIELTKEGVESLQTKNPYTLITYSDSCASPLVAVTVKTSGTCKKVNVKKISDAGTLGALFAVDSSGCKTWWIILVSVICGIILLAIIVLIILVACVPSINDKVFRYRKRSRAGRANV